MSQQGRRTRSKQIAPVGGTVDPTDIQLSPSQKLLYTGVIPVSNPVVSTTRGFDNILTTRIKQVLAAHDNRLYGDADRLGRYSVYSIEMTRYKESNMTSYQANVQHATILVEVYAKIVRTFRNSDGSVIPGIREETQEFLLAPIPNMKGSIADSVSDRREAYEKGDEPLLPNGYFTIDGRKQYIVLYNKLKYDMPITYAKDGEIITSVICTTPDMSTVQIIVNNDNKQKMICRTSILGSIASDTDKKQKAKHRYIGLYDFMAVLMTRRETVKFVDKSTGAVLTTEVDVDPKDNAITELILSFVPPEHVETARDILLLSEGHQPKDEVVAALRASIKLSEKSYDLERSMVEEIYPAIPYEQKDLKARQLAYVASRHLLYMCGIHKPHDRDSPALYRMDTPEIVITKLLADKLRAVLDIFTSKNGASETGISDLQANAIVERLLQNPNTKVNELYKPIASINLINSLSKMREEFVLAFKKGNFGGKTIKNPPQGFKAGMVTTQKGVVAPLETNSFSQAWGCVTRRAITSSSKGKSIKVRSGHPLRAGYEDLWKSPDNQMIGLVSFLAGTEYNSTWRDATPVVLAIGVLPQHKDEVNPDLVLVNGIIQGYANGRLLVQRLNKLRTNGDVLAPFFDSMFMYDAKRLEVQILTDAGRMTRPLLTVEGNELVIDKLGLPWTSSLDALLRAGAIRYVDSYEAEYGATCAQFPDYFRLRWDEIAQAERVYTQLQGVLANAEESNVTEVDGVNVEYFLKTLNGYRVAYKRGIRPEVVPLRVDLPTLRRQLGLLNVHIERGRSLLRYNYCEIDADVILGFSGAIVPFINRNSSTKIAYSEHITTMAVGQGSSNGILASAPILRNLNVGQRGMTETGMAKIVGTGVLPASQNAIVAIIPGTAYGDYGGGTQEDAIQLKQSAVDRGLVNYTIHKQIVYSASVTSGTVVRSSRPIGEAYNDKYGNLDMRGVVIVGTEVLEGDVVFSLESQSSAGRWKRKDIVAKPGEKGIVTDVFYTQDPLYIQIRLSEVRKPGPGSKVANMHGGKGIVVEITPDDQMPIEVTTGLSPDIIFNPVGIAPRGTMGFMIEMIAGMASALLGQRANACGMSQDYRVDQPGRILALAGFNSYSEFKLVDRRSGETYRGDVSMGIMQLQLLNMTAEETKNWVGKVDRHPWNMQPVKGKKKGGGVRMGTQEYDGISYHGMEGMRQSVYGDASDAITVPLCFSCGRFASASHKIGQYQCTYCSSQLPTEELHKARNIVQVKMAGAWRHIIQVLRMGGIDVVHDLKLRT